MTIDIIKQLLDSEVFEDNLIAVEYIINTDDYLSIVKELKLDQHIINMTDYWHTNRTLVTPESHDNRYIKGKHLCAVFRGYGICFDTPKTVANCLRNIPSIKMMEYE